MRVWILYDTSLLFNSINQHNFMLSPEEFLNKNKKTSVYTLRMLSCLVYIDIRVVFHLSKLKSMGRVDRIGYIIHINAVTS